jgi:hypothetical protein
MSVEDLALLDELAAVLAPPADLRLEPSPSELDALRAAVAAKFPERAESGVVIHPPRWRRLGSAARTGGMAAAIVVFSASAAATATGATTGVLPLPRPVRAAAHALGLPVDSLALDDAHQHLGDLRHAMRTGNEQRARQTIQKLRRDVARLPE